VAYDSLKTDDSIVTDAVVRHDGTVTWIRPIIYTVTSYDDVDDG